MRKGLDHRLDCSGKGIAVLHHGRSRAARSGPARFVIPAGSAALVCRSASGDWNDCDGRVDRLQCYADGEVQGGWTSVERGSGFTLGP